ncbi:MAG: TylF/MycF/NovP-related O-methyltransferase [Alphaproteobacteria bacterium]|nr:TylF/MycF/NovP-related O-methyltransferase [Alphaproteobacteria bacterium]
MENDTFYYLSGGEDAYFSRLEKIAAAHPHTLRHHLDLFPAYASRRSFIRLLVHYELFKLTMDLPGHYVDFGVYYGKSFFSWHKFVEVLTPTATHKKIIGFDTFTGFSELTAKDGDSNPAIQKKQGGLSAKGFLEELNALVKLHNEDGVLPSTRGSLVQGDVTETLPQWLTSNPEARFCLINIDVDIYEPTRAILQHCWDRLVVGGVLILDEYATTQWPGETNAWDEFARARGITSPIKRFAWANAPGGYLVKEAV